MTLFTESDFDIAARTLWGEARGEDRKGREAVAHVFFNRLKKQDGQFSRDDTLATTCLRHVQFSVWNQQDANFPKLFEVDYGNVDLRQCLAIVLEISCGVPDPTKGATHYHTRAVSPYWAQDHTPCYETEGHLFYNNVR
jgi:N-acetylmuramoyl-L-alanine amidase